MYDVQVLNSKEGRVRQSSLARERSCGFGRGRDSERGSSCGDPVSFGRGSDHGPDVSSATCDSLFVIYTDAPKRAGPRSAGLGGNRRLSARRRDRESFSRGLAVEPSTGGLLAVGRF